ncbi:MAG: DUF3313 domain-containing protein [Luteibacter sp.]
MRKSLPLIAGVLALALATATAATLPPPSGFLDAYPTKMVPDPKRPGAFIYIVPGGTLKGFTKVQVDPILVWYAKDSAYQGIDPNELSAVTQNMRKALTQSLEPKYPIVEVGGPDVLRLRIAITNVVAEKKKRGILGYTPIGFVVGAAKDMATAGPNVNLDSAVVEAEVLDATGKQISVVIDPLISGDEKKDKLTWDGLNTVMEAAGQRLRARLDGDNPR